ncbi:metal-dependent hydrolase [Methylophaga sp.]|uniref:metal-dependent hydrolase n=2 Tax=unclassified Methylophaga TaxID=2629249 RepID=UPI000C8AD963|nr:metal-dependent hydrolase [Methylophaga sp.]MAY18830.1 metal-dependent hydrolase [Methylophaga sp.]
MDTITQALLGSAVAYSVAGRKAPRASIFYGATFGILPDLDVFIQYANDLDTMTLHRSWTHSWLMQSLLAPIVAWLMCNLAPVFDFRRWFMLIWLVWVTHSGLDAMTVYGTQLFWPFMPPPVSIGSIFIIDPIYSLPLVAGFLAILIAAQNRLSHFIMLGALILTTAYLGWSLGAQHWVTRQTQQALAEQQIEYQHIKITPAPLNTLLWRIVVIDEAVYYEAFRSVFDGDAAFRFTQYERGSELKGLLPDQSDLERLDWFTQNNFKLQQLENIILATDLRMGMEPAYFFRFQLARIENDEVITLPPKQLSMPRNAINGLYWVWQRIWDDQAELINKNGSE